MEGQKMLTLGVSRLETPVTTSNSVTAGFRILW